MRPSARTVVTYSIVVLVLFGAIIGGVMWAKGRSQQIATQQPPAQPAQTQDAPDDSKPDDEAELEPSVAGANAQQDNNENPTQVPAAGANDWLVVLAGLLLVTFASTKLIQGRVQLASSKASR